MEDKNRPSIAGYRQPSAGSMSMPAPSSIRTAPSPPRDKKKPASPENVVVVPTASPTKGSEDSSLLQEKLAMGHRRRLSSTQTPTKTTANPASPTASPSDILSEKDAARDQRVQRHRRNRSDMADASSPSKETPMDGPQLASAVSLCYEEEQELQQHGQQQEQEALSPGAFRVYPEGYNPDSSSLYTASSKTLQVDDQRRADDGGGMVSPAAQQAGFASQATTPNQQSRDFAMPPQEEESGGIKGLWIKRKRLVIGLLLLVVIGIAVGVAVPLSSSSSNSTPEEISSPPPVSTTPPPSPPPETPPPVFTSPTVNVTVLIQLDRRPRQTQWNLTCDDVPYGFAIYFDYETPNELIIEQVEVPRDSTCVFIIQDSFNNGLCCESGNGFYEVSVGSKIVAEGAEFIAIEISEPFVATPPPPTMAPTISTSVINTINVTVEIQLDRNPQQTQWSLECDGEEIVQVPFFAYLTPSELVSTSVQVEEGSRCAFVIEDSGMDGICCSNGDGFYRVFVIDGNDALVVAEGGEFTVRDEPPPFVATTNMTSAPTVSPTVGL